MKRKSRCQPARLVLGKHGKHTFGGPPIHPGATPAGSNVPLHRVLTLDASDPLCPLDDCPTRQLPLYYPMKYGFGGAEVEYLVHEDGGVSLVFMSTQEPADSPYVTAEAFPEIPGKLVPLSYEEARLLSFMDVDCCFQPQGRDRKLIKDLDPNNLIRVGGNPMSCQGEVHFECRNSKCDWFGRTNPIDLIAIVPTFRLDETTNLWEEYTGCEFCFGVCKICGAVIGVNRCT